MKQDKQYYHACDKFEFIEVVGAFDEYNGNRGQGILAVIDNSTNIIHDMHVIKT